MLSRNDGRITDMMYLEPKAYTLEYTIVFVNDDFEISYYTSNDKSNFQPIRLKNYFFIAFISDYYFIYTKNRTPGKELVEEIYKRLEENNISKEIFRNVEQEGCPDVF